MVIVFSAIVFLADALGRVWGFLGDLVLILFLSWLVGSLLIHVVDNLMRVPHMPRAVAILIVYLGLIILVLVFAFLVIPATSKQVLELAEKVPSYVEQLPGLITNAQNFLAGLGIELDLLNELQLDSVDKLAATITTVLTNNAVSIAQNLVSAIFATSLVIVISFYIVLDGGRRLDEALKVLPPTAERETRLVLQTIDSTFHGYIRGMLVVSLIYGVGTASVMMLTGLPAALPVAIISSVLLAVPFIGDWLALALPLLIAAIAGDFITFLIVLSTLLFVQQVMLNLLTPRILGHAVRMPAMLVIIAVVLGARLAGIPGALLGVPTAAVIYTLSVNYGMRIRERRERRTIEAQEAQGAPTPAPLDEPPVPVAKPPQQEPTKEEREPIPLAGSVQQPVAEQPATATEAAEVAEGADFEEQLRQALGAEERTDRGPRGRAG